MESTHNTEDTEYRTVLYFFLPFFLTLSNKQLDYCTGIRDHLFVKELTIS